MEDNWYSLTTEDVLEKLNVDKSGHISFNDFNSFRFNIRSISNFKKNTNRQLNLFVFLYIINILFLKYTLHILYQQLINII